MTKNSQHPINRVVIIKEESSADFIKQFNESKVTEEFLISCRKAGELFNNENRKRRSDQN